MTPLVRARWCRAWASMGHVRILRLARAVTVRSHAHGDRSRKDRTRSPRRSRRRRRLGRAAAARHEGLRRAVRRHRAARQDRHPRALLAPGRRRRCTSPTARCSARVYAAAAPRVPLPSWARGPAAATGRARRHLAADVARLDGPPGRQATSRRCSPTRARSPRRPGATCCSASSSASSSAASTRPTDPEIPSYEHVASTNGHGDLEAALSGARTSEHTFPFPSAARPILRPCRAATLSSLRPPASRSSRRCRASAPKPRSRSVLVAMGHRVFLPVGHEPALRPHRRGRRRFLRCQCKTGRLRSGAVALQRPKRPLEHANASSSGATTARSTTSSSTARRQTGVYPIPIEDARRHRVSPARRPRRRNNQQRRIRWAADYVLPSPADGRLARLDSLASAGVAQLVEHGVL